MRPYDITLTIQVKAKSAEAAKQLLQRRLRVKFDDSFRFNRIDGAIYCPGCGKNEITGVRWSQRYKGIESVQIDGSVCCSHDEGEFPTEESARVSVDFFNNKKVAQ